jgi:hypothetical protein
MFFGTRIWSPVSRASKPNSSPFLAIIPSLSGVANGPRPGIVKPYFMAKSPVYVKYQIKI